MTKEYERDYQAYLEKWGLDAQLLMAMEEMSELTKEICKYIRYSTFEQEYPEKLDITIENLKAEIADVLNTVEQLEYCFGTEAIEKIRKSKIDRTNKLLEKEE